ncbi:MAG: hypothetical protein ACKOWF_16080, partial [Chloroflexota bacterium]
TDRNNCGAVGQTCCDGKTCPSVTDRICCDGRCSDDLLKECCLVNVPGKPEPQLILVNPKNNPNHCGGCGKQCPGDQACCNGACVDLLNNPKHCGNCGHDCGSGKYCTKGLCCARNEDACPGKNGLLYCTDITSDPLNCGYCGRTSSGNLGCQDSQFCHKPGQECLQIHDIAPNREPDPFNNSCCKPASGRAFCSKWGDGCIV